MSEQTPSLLRKESTGAVPSDTSREWRIPSDLPKGLLRMQAVDESNDRIIDIIIHGTDPEAFRTLLEKNPHLTEEHLHTILGSEKLSIKREEIIAILRSRGTQANTPPDAQRIVRITEKIIENQGVSIVNQKNPNPYPMDEPEREDGGVDERVNTRRFLASLRLEAIHYGLGVSNIPVTPDSEIGDYILTLPNGYTIPVRSTDLITQFFDLYPPEMDSLESVTRWIQIQDFSGKTIKLYFWLQDQLLLATDRWIPTYRRY